MCPGGIVLVTHAKPWHQSLPPQTRTSRTKPFFLIIKGKHASVSRIHAPTHSSNVGRGTGILSMWEYCPTTHTIHTHTYFLLVLLFLTKVESRCVFFAISGDKPGSSLWKQHLALGSGTEMMSSVGTDAIQFWSNHMKIWWHKLSIIN